MHIDEEEDCGCESATPSGMGEISVMCTRMELSLVRQTLAPVSAIDDGGGGLAFVRAEVGFSGRPMTVNVMSS